MVSRLRIVVINFVGFRREVRFYLGGFLGFGGNGFFD